MPQTPDDLQPWPPGGPHKHVHLIKSQSGVNVRVEHGLGTMELISVTVWKQISPHAIYPGGPKRRQVYPGVAIVDENVIVVEFFAPLFTTDEYMVVTYG